MSCRCCVGGGYGLGGGYVLFGLTVIRGRAVGDGIIYLLPDSRFGIM